MPSTPEIVFDCCVLSNYAQAASLELIRRMYSGVACVTTVVSSENLRGIQGGHEGLTAVRDALRERWLVEIALKTRAELGQFEALSVSLGQGEASSIALAKARSLVFACDDKAARREATILGVRLTGTIGILLRAVRDKLLSRSEADALLVRMIKAGFYSPVRSLEELK
ncbi:MAG: DUF3368 domain-containing protein [Candidatus Methylomirabilia bacterium]